jgi:hypothetical protein
LLTLLRPDLFPDEQAFIETIEPNEHLFAAMRLIRASHRQEQWQANVAMALQRAAATGWGRHVLMQDPRFTDMLSQMRSGESVSDAERIRALRDLEEIHSLAHVLNRTRRRDISQVFTQREPFTVSVPFTEPQYAFYQALIEFRRQVLLLRYDPAPCVPRLAGERRHRRWLVAVPSHCRSGNPALARFSSSLTRASHGLCRSSS